MVSLQVKMDLERLRGTHLLCCGLLHGGLLDCWLLLGSLFEVLAELIAGLHLQRGHNINTPEVDIRSRC